MRHWLLATLLAAALAAPSSAQSYRDERITSYDSDVTINKDSSINVVEAITSHQSQAIVVKETETHEMPIRRRAQRARPAVRARLPRAVAPTGPRS